MRGGSPRSLNANAGDVSPWNAGRADLGDLVTGIDGIVATHYFAARIFEHRVWLKLTVGFGELPSQGCEV